MTPEHPSPRAGESYLRLAAYTDGELDPITRQALEQWLATCPQAVEILRDQEQFSPGNSEFWLQVAPPEPSAADWQRLMQALADRLAIPQDCQLTAEQQSPLSQRLPRGFSRLPTIAAAIAVGLLLVTGIWGIRSPETPLVATSLPSADPSDGVATTNTPRANEVANSEPLTVPTEPMAVLPMATAKDVLIESVLGETTAVLPGLELPIADRFTLALMDDVQVEQWRPASSSTHRAVLTGDTDSPIVIVAVLDAAKPGK